MAFPRIGWYLNRLKDEIESLEGKSAKKDGVMAELLADYVALKKELGEP